MKPNVDAKSYFRNIFDNVTSIAIGMKITIKYCFQKTVTVQYPEQHLSFGFGPHVCPGATLTRIEAREGIRTFLDHFPPGSVRLAPDFEWENVPTYFERGPKRLPVVIEPA